MLQLMKKNISNRTTWEVDQVNTNTATALIKNIILILRFLTVFHKRYLSYWSVHITSLWNNRLKNSRTIIVIIDKYWKIFAICCFWNSNKKNFVQHFKLLSLFHFFLKIKHNKNHTISFSSNFKLRQQKTRKYLFTSFFIFIRLKIEHWLSLVLR